MDFVKVKRELFAGSGAHIEKVEVNQRHLIDKILARYSAEFTVYRELIQNANDAMAKEIQIDFVTDKTTSAEDRPRICSVVVRNDGRAFTDEDWHRLKRIAEGNPDEQKIGFFGVGFYSLFSICEEPLVLSGTRCMGFYWQGDQLYTKSAAHQSEDGAKWTSICLQLRELYEMPDPDAFSQFLTKSLLFTSALMTASFSVNGALQLRASKLLSPASSLSLSSIHCRTGPQSDGLFVLSAMDCQSHQLTIDKRYSSVEPTLDKTSPLSVVSGLWRLAQSKLTARGREDAALEARLREPGLFHVFFRHFRGTANVKTSSRFATEMERTTKKKPAKTVHVSLIYANWEQTHAASDGHGAASLAKHPILSRLLPHPTKGHVFIGFETHQTSGIGLHLAAPFVPTVERESIDFVDGTLKTWNLELLQLMGKMCRVVYDDEAGCINAADSGYLQRAKHLMECLNFQQSTPSSLVSWTLFEAFMHASQSALRLPSSRGFVPANQLRFVPEDMLAFVKHAPRVPDEIAKTCQDMLQKLNAMSRDIQAQIPTLSVRDVIKMELKGEGRQMDDQETLACLKWWLQHLSLRESFASQHDQDEYYRLVQEFNSSFRVPSAARGRDGETQMISLSQAKFYASDELAGLFMSQTHPSVLKSFPCDCLSPQLTSKLDVDELSLLLGLEELNAADWLDGLVRSSSAREELEGRQENCEQLLLFLSRIFTRPPRSLSMQMYQGRLCNALSGLRCIPVAGGLVKPSDCYFEDIPQRQLLDELPIVAFSSAARRCQISDDLLRGAGVRSHLPLDQIFSNIDGLSWDHRQLIKYLVKIRGELSSGELDKLRQASMFPAVGGDERRFRLNQLHSPSPVTSILKLPVLSWRETSDASGEKPPKIGSEVGDFLKELGFNFVVSWKAVLGGVKDASSAERAVLFRYFFDNYSAYEPPYDSKKCDFPFVPVDSEDEKDARVFHPSQVFLDGELSILGFYQPHAELRRHAQLLGVKERPQTRLIVEQVAKQRLSVQEATAVFGYMARISNGLSESDWRMLRESSFIPLKMDGGDGGDDSRVAETRNETPTVYRSYNQVFFKDGSRDESDRQVSFSGLFDQIDFGVQANSFLRAVGVLDEPRAEHLVQLLLRDAAGIFANLKTHRYMELLERLAAVWPAFSKKHAGLARSFVSSRSFVGVIHVHSPDNDAVDELAKGMTLTAISPRTVATQPTQAESTAPTVQYSLYALDAVFLIDDTISQQIFNLPACPSLMKPQLEPFYQSLGARWLSSVIRTEWKCHGEARESGSLAVNVRRLLDERLGLIVHSLEETELDKIQKRGAQRVKGARVLQVDAIKISRLCTTTRQESVQSASAYCDNASTATVFVARGVDGQFDHFDLAAVVVGLLCGSRARLRDSLLVSSLLTTSLTSLRAKGFATETPEVALTKERLPSAVPTTEPPLTVSNTEPLLTVSKTEPLLTVSKTEPLATVSKTKHLQSPSSQPTEAPLVKTSPMPPASPVSSASDSGSGRLAKSPLKRFGAGVMEFIRKSAGTLPRTDAGTQSTGGMLPPSSLKPAGEPTDGESLSHALNRGIRSLRRNHADDFSAAIVRDEPAPASDTLRHELAGYCETRGAESLRFVRKLERGVQMYAGMQLEEAEVDAVVRHDGEALQSFYTLIVDVLALQVFRVADATVVHFYYDPQSTTVAFNRAHALFFNYAYFLANRHAEQLRGEDVAARRCRAFWFITFCHELAHNFVAAHDAQHEFYLSSFAEVFLPSLLPHM